jgi:hypothetical protein
MLGFPHDMAPFHSHWKMAQTDWIQSEASSWATLNVLLTGTRALATRALRPPDPVTGLEAGGPAPDLREQQ